MSILNQSSFFKNDKIGEISPNVPSILSVLGRAQFAVNVKDVKLKYGQGSSAVFCLTGASLNIRKGTIYALLGPSGCGKTSLLRCVLGCIKPESGEIRVFGYKPGDRACEIPGPAVGYMPQDIALNEDLTITEMLTYFGRLSFMKQECIKLRITELHSQMALPNHHQMISTLSGGEKRRVSFICALINKPKLLVLDEPTVGVDPILRERIWDILIELTAFMTTVVVTTHYIEETRRSDTVGFMRKGKLLTENKPENILCQFQCKTLEEVFYKLCLKDKKQVGIIGNSLSLYSLETKLDQTFPYNSWFHIVGDFISNINCRQWFSILLTMLWKVTIQSIRFRGSILLQFILPILTIVMYCICIGGVAKDIMLAVVNDENPPYLSEIYLRNIDPKFIKIVNYSDFHSANDALKRNKVWAAVYINANFSESLMKRYEAFDDFNEDGVKMGQIKVIADITNRVLVMTLLRALESAFEGFSREALKTLNYNQRLLDPPIRLEEAINGKYSKIFDLTNFMVPGLLILVTYTFSFASTLLLTMCEKNEKIFDRNKVAGVTTIHIILSHIILKFIVMSATAIVLILIALIFFDLPTKGSLFWAVILLLLQVIAGLTMGVMVSTLCTSLSMAVILSNGILFFIFIISGVLWSTESLPYWMEWFSFIQPTTLPTKSLRNILSRGLQITEFAVYRGYFVSIVYIAIFSVVSIIFFPH